MHPHALETHSVFYLMRVHQVFIMPRNHYLSKHFFERIERIIESGIVDKYIKLYTFRYSLKAEDESNEREFKLTLRILMGVFIILLTGHCVALIAFACEILFHKYSTRKFKIII